jgi:PAS domain S-box-containing protein
LLRARDRVRDYLIMHCSDGGVVDDVVLAIEEAFTNAIRHSGSQKDIELAVSFEGHDLTAVVRDQGTGFDVDAFDPDKAPDILAPGGRGLFLMAHLMDELTLVNDGGLQARMIKRNVARRASPSLASSLGDLNAGSWPAYKDARQRAVLEEIDEVFAALDWEYRYVHVNDAGVRAAGLPRQQMLGRRLWDLLPGLQDAPLGQAVREAMELGKPSVVEHESLPGHWLETRIYPTSSGVSMFTRDISESKRAQAERERLLEELRRSGERADFLADVVESAAMPFGAGAPDGRLLLFNQAFADLTGYSRAELEEMHITWLTVLTPPEWREAEAEWLATAVRERRPVSYEKEYVRKDGSRVPVELFVQPIFDDAGHLLHYRSFVTDITERKRAEHALRESEQRYFALFEESPFAVALTKMPEGITVGVNEAFLRLFELDRAEALGKTSIDLGIAEPDARAQVEAQLEKRGIVTDFECTRFTKSGQKRLLSLTVNPVVIGGERHVLTTLRDVTEQRAAEEAVRRQSAELAERAELAEALNRVNRLVHSTLEFDEVVQRSLDEGMRVLGLDGGLIELREESGWLVRYQRGFGPATLGVRTSDAHVPVAVRAVKSGETIAIADLAADPCAAGGLLHGQGSVVCAPLFTREEAVGALLLVGREARAFSDAEIDFTRKLGATVSLALANVRLYQGERGAERLGAAALGGRVGRAVRGLRTRPQLTLLLALMAEAAYLVPIGTVSQIRHTLGIPGSLLAVTAVLSGALAGPLIGSLSGAFGGAIFYATVGQLGARISVYAILISTAMWIAVGLLSGLLAEGLREEARRRLQASIALAKAEAARVEQLAVEREREELIDELQAKSDELQVQAEELRSQAAELQVQREELAAVIEQTEACVVLLDRDFNFLLVNSAYAKTCGYEPREMIGLNHFALYPHAENEAIFRHVRDTGEAVQYIAKPFAFPDQPKRGVTYWDWRLAPIKDHLGRVTRLVFSLVEVTERVRSMKLTEALAEIEATVHASLGFDQMLASALLSAREALECESAAVSLRQAPSGWVVHTACGLDRDMRGAVRDDEQERHALLAIQTGRPVAIEDTSRDECVNGEHLRAWGVGAVLVVPLLRKDEALGALYFNYPSPHAFSEAELAFAKRLGSALSLAIENAQKEDQLRELAAARYARSLIEASPDPLVTISVEGKITDVNEATERVTGLPRTELIGTDFSDYFTDPEAARAGYRRVFAEGSVTDYPLAIRRQDGYVTDVLYNATVYRDEGGEVAGVFAAARDITELKRAELASIENARRFEQQRAISTTLQESLIHPLPKIDGLSLAALSLPAGREELIGGDFRDVFALPDGTVVALVGDVMGKGIKAAGLTETVRAAVRTLALISPSPEYILAHANRLLMHEDEHQQLVTAILAVLDSRTGRGSLASAGHPPPILLSDEGCRAVEPLYGLPLGAMEQSYAAAEFALKPGDVLVLYTDGVTEARRNGDLFGERRLLEALSVAPAREPQQIVEHVRDAVVSYAAELRDDVQLLALRRTS